MNGHIALAIAQAIRANVDAFYAETITHAEFTERQAVLWGRTNGDVELNRLVAHVLWRDP